MSGRAVSRKVPDATAGASSLRQEKRPVPRHSRGMSNKNLFGAGAVGSSSI